MWMTISKFKSLTVGNWKEDGAKNIITSVSIANLDTLNFISFSSSGHAVWDVQNG